METVGRLLILGMAVTFYLLAYESESFMAIPGHTFGVLLTLALLASFARKSGYPGKRGD
jgi:hypothetical protein